MNRYYGSLFYQYTWLNILGGLLSVGYFRN